MAQLKRQKQARCTLSCAAEPLNKKNIKNTSLQKNLLSHSVGIIYKIKTINYSTVLNNTCGYAFLNTNFFFCFTITQRTPHLNVRLYSEYQLFLYQTITEQREKEKTYDQIAEWLNKKGYLSVRGKKFRGAHVHSIVKKKRLKDEKFEKEYPEVRSDFYLDIFDRTLINMVKSDD